RKWQVVNCGGISYASYRLVPILQEVLGHEPDLIILYTGHNEFLEDREYGHIRDIPGFVSGLWELVAQTRTYNLLREGWARLRGPARPGAAAERPVLGPEADAVLDYKGGLAKYHRDEQRRRGVIEHFRCNLRRMIGLCRESGVAVLLVNPVSSLRDCAPFKSQHRRGLTDEQRRRWEGLLREAGRRLGRNPFGAVDLLRRASAIDDQRADLHYLLGRCFDAMGRPEQARQAYIRAKELDVCPLRMLEPMHEIVLDVARRTDTPLLDARKLIERHSRDGIPGGYLMLDHVHPSIRGHRLIADALTGELIRQGVVHPAAGWKKRRDEKVRQHTESLDDFYFAKGQERLEAVRKWAAGRATFVRPRTQPRTP
ncbi:MAG: tetratricopeptide repeat protein, partial [Phycisphaerae bacterium]